MSSEIRECEECGRKEPDWHLVDSDKFGKILCDKCYSRYTRNNNGSDEFRVCEYCGITSEEARIIKSRKYKKTLCEKHYQYYSNTGKLKRTIKDRNQIIVKENYAVIKLYDKNSSEIAETIIDKENIALVKDYKWYLVKKEGGRNYAYSSTLPIHRLIMGVSKRDRELYVDHINRDGLDNRKENLRLTNNKYNQGNSKLPKNNTSGYKGVYKKRNKWVATIKVDRESINLGTFENKLDAMLIRKEAEEKYFGEFRRNNDEYLEELLKKERNG